MTAINPEGWLRAPGWSHATVAKLGNERLVKVAGQVGWDMKVQKIVSEDLVEQYGQALRNIRTILETADGNVGNIVDLHLYTVELDEFNRRAKEIGKTYIEIVGKHFPAITLLGVSRLFSPDVKIEIAATAVLSDRSGGEQ